MSALRNWSGLRWLAAAGATILTTLAIGIPTDLIDTPLFSRMTPARWWDYPLWLVSAALAGLVLASYVRSAPVDSTAPTQTVGASVLSVFAVGCPVCNKLVVAALGFSGALTFFEPIQPLLGLASVAILVHALRIRIRAERSCSPMTVTP
jgi:hypothetical protein